MKNLKLQRIVMEVFGGCNYTCQMCPQTNPGRGASFKRKMPLNEFKRILSDVDLFESILEKLIVEWKYSCEHYLTNRSMNRIAWLGQASVCIVSGVPSRYSGAWFDVSESKRDLANYLALEYLNKWLSNNKRGEVDMYQALNSGRQIELY